MNKRTIITVFKGFAIPVLVLVALAGQAQEKTDSTKTKEHGLMLFAEVKDHLTHEAVKGVRGELLHAADSTFADTLSISYQEDGDWKYGYIEASIRQAGSYLIRLEADSFQTAYVPLDIKKLYKREQYRHLKTIYLRRLPKKWEGMLDEVVVQSTKLKFYLDGDTLVYNADAFQMAEGSMLDALIKKLPGVELESGGVIKVNGRQVSSLLLNGKDFFDSDRELLLENMPSYMVKNIKSYERVPEDARGTNREKTVQKELVMDVKLKREYNSGWIANAEAGGLTPGPSPKERGVYTSSAENTRVTSNHSPLLGRGAGGEALGRGEGGEAWPSLRPTLLRPFTPGGLCHHKQPERLPHAWERRRLARKPSRLSRLNYRGVDGNAGVSPANPAASVD